MLYNTKFFVKLLLLAYIVGVQNFKTTAGRDYNFKMYNGSQIPSNYTYAKYFARLVYKRQICAGVIIKSNAIMTAAQCITLDAEKDKISPDDVAKATVCVGTTRMTCAGEGVQELDVKNVILHPMYKTPSLGFDIAIVILKKDFNINGQTVASAEISDQAAQEGAVCDIIGWGNTICFISGLSLLPPILTYTSLVVVEPEWCQANFPRPIRSSHICAIDKRRISMMCPGDIGAGLFCDGHVAGILSMTNKVWSEPTVFSDVHFVRGWIRNILQEYATDGSYRRSFGVRCLQSAYVNFVLPIIFILNYF